MFRLNKNTCFVIITITAAFVLCFYGFKYRDEQLTKESLAALPIFELNYENYIVETSVNPKLSNDSAYHETYDFICNEDKAKTSLISIDFTSQTPDDLRMLFHKFVQNPHLGRCPILQRYGGSYLEVCQYWDGHKYVCLPQLQHDIKNDACLIYSFGVSTDWSFEKAMNDFGCQVLMFDPTVNYQKQLGNKLSFEKLGVAARRNEEKLLDTFSSILQRNGHLDRKITYLKNDIEGAEVDCLLEWFESDALKNVQQLGLEFHLPDTETTLKFFYALVKLYALTDFRLVSFDINGCAGKYSLFNKYAEIVMMRSSEESICIENSKEN